MNTLKTLAAATLGAFALAGCGPDYGDRTTGQKVDTAVANTQAALETAGEKTANALNRAADGVKNLGDKIESKIDAKTTGASADDTRITASIKTDLVKDPDLSALKIEVATNNGVVTLNGVAPDEAAADRAGRIAIAVKGVTEVRNHVVARKS